MSKEQQLLAFGAYMENAVTDLKHYTGKPWGSVLMTPSSTIGYIVRKSDVMINFSTEGKDKNLSSTELLEFVNKQKILVTPFADGKYLEVSIGKKNKLKVSIQLSFELNSYDDIDDDQVRDKIAESINKLIDIFSDLVIPKKRQVKPKAASQSNVLTQEKENNIPDMSDVVE